MQIFKFSRSSNKYQIQDYRRKRNFLEFITTQTFDPETQRPNTKISFKSEKVFKDYFKNWIKEEEEKEEKEVIEEIKIEPAEPEEISEEEKKEIARLEEIRSDTRNWNIDLICFRKYERKSRRKLKRFPFDSNVAICLKRVKEIEPKKGSKGAKKEGKGRRRGNKVPEVKKQKEEWEISSDSDCFWLETENTKETQPTIKPEFMKEYKEPFSGKSFTSRREGWQIRLDNYKGIKADILERIKANRKLKKVIEDEKIMKKKRRKGGRKKEKKDKKEKTEMEKEKEKGNESQSKVLNTEGATGEGKDEDPKETVKGDVKDAKLEEMEKTKQTDETKPETDKKEEIKEQTLGNEITKIDDSEKKNLKENLLKENFAENKIDQKKETPLIADSEKEVIISDKVVEKKIQITLNLEKEKEDKQKLEISADKENPKTLPKPNLN